MQPEPILLYHTRLAPADECLRRLIEFFGLGCRTVDASAFDREWHRTPDHELCILASATSIERWCSNCPDPAAALDGLREKALALFVYGFTPGMSSASVAARLSDGAITDVRALAGAGVSYHVSSQLPDVTKEFSGLTFARAPNGTEFGFACAANSSGANTLVSIGEMPIWIALKQKFCTTFLLACKAIADIQERVTGVDPGKYFSRLLPAAMFLRWV
ncbi:MAG TPA: hypothetical protein VJS37_17385, partial [Terriglobales bacterium]|nr:hypothetical protein [Terriglobales bacterium]